MTGDRSPRERREARKRATEQGAPAPSERRKSEVRVPAWIVIPLAGAAGFFTAQWMGLALGLALGIFLWRMRS